MDARPYTQHDLRRAAEERRKADRALTEEARRLHLDLAEIFEARAGLFPAAGEGSNVIPLRPNGSVRKASRAAPAAPRTRPARRRSAPQAG